VKITDQLVESREDRLTAADLGLPPIFWEVIAFLLVLWLVSPRSSNRSAGGPYRSAG
jgi:hypothetical protein